MSTRSNRNARRAQVALLALLGLGISGCASSGTRAAAPTVGSSTTVVSGTTVAVGVGGGSSACALVTEQDASTAIGSPAGTGTSRTQEHATQCIFGTGALVVTEDTAGKGAYDQERSAITAAPAGTWADVSGVGDAAFTSHGGPVVSVIFYKGDTHVAIILSGSTTSVPTDAAVTLAKAAAARL